MSFIDTLRETATTKAEPPKKKWRNHFLCTQDGLVWLGQERRMGEVVKGKNIYPSEDLAETAVREGLKAGRWHPLAFPWMGAYPEED